MAPSFCLAGSELVQGPAVCGRVIKGTHLLLDERIILDYHICPVTTIFKDHKICCYIVTHLFTELLDFISGRVLLYFILHQLAIEYLDLIKSVSLIK